MSDLRQWITDKFGESPQDLKLWERALTHARGRHTPDALRAVWAERVGAEAVAALKAGLEADGITAQEGEI